jgi:ubiquinone/menaquinone biosynthesis C-methylase UbiE
MTLAPVDSLPRSEAFGERPLPWTGERMVPELAPAHVFWEHVYRYRFASQFVRGKSVLDIACGEGYGACGLQRSGAAHVIGIDCCAETCRHAAAKYGIDARAGDAAEIPIQSSRVETLVSFETIEHLESPDLFLRECVRVLASDGLAIISSPNRDEYRAGAGPNQFHHSEMNREEFRTLLQRHFGRVEMYSQYLIAAPAYTCNSLAAFESPWLRLNGFWRFRRWALRDVCDVDIYEPTVPRQYRENPILAILAQDGPVTRLLNPLDVRKSSRSPQERATYQVAVCRYPKKRSVETK